MARTFQTRTGLSLLELLVAIAIIAILFGLLMSAVQGARAAADRIRCANNLRQLALAAHLHHDVEAAFPRGFSGDTYSPNNPFPYTSWQTRLLPHLEQQALADRSIAAFQADRYPFNPAHLGVRDIPLSINGCPSDPRVQVAWIAKGKRVAYTTYLGNGGRDHRDTEGVLHAGSHVRLTDIRDGSSQTLLIGERPPSPDMIFGWWYAASGQDGQGSLDFFLGARERNTSFISAYGPCGVGPFAYRSGRIDDPCDVFHYWSFHAGGANFAFADGSVRFVRYSANDVLPALATRAGGETSIISE